MASGIRSVKLYINILLNISRKNKASQNASNTLPEHIANLIAVTTKMTQIAAFLTIKKILSNIFKIKYNLKICSYFCKDIKSIERSSRFLLN